MVGLPARAVVSAVAAVSWMIVGVVIVAAVHASWHVEAGLFAFGVGVVWARGGAQSRQRALRAEVA